MKFRTIVSVLFIITIGLGITALNPKWKKEFKSFFVSDSRKILATLETSLYVGGPHLKILKIKQSDQIVIEIFQSDSTGNQFNLFQKIELTDRTEGFFTFQGNATNLAAADTDQDQYIEILVPTFDDQGFARLSTYKFDKDAKQFFKQDLE